jgi:hypothetical protein
MIVKLVGNIGLIFEAGERLYSDFFWLQRDLLLKFRFEFSQ